MSYVGFSPKQRRVLTWWMPGGQDAVQIDHATMVYATEFSAEQNRQVKQVADAQTGEKRVVSEEVIWTLTLEEVLPFRETIADDTKEPFTLSVQHDNCREIYPECYWLSITQEETDGGLMRKRIARSWAERIIESEAEQQE